MDRRTFLKATAASFGLLAVAQAETTETRQILVWWRTQMNLDDAALRRDQIVVSGKSYEDMARQAIAQFPTATCIEILQGDGYDVLPLAFFRKVETNSGLFIGDKNDPDPTKSTHVKFGEWIKMTFPNGNANVDKANL